MLSSTLPPLALKVYVPNDCQLPPFGALIDVDGRGAAGMGDLEHGTLIADGVKLMPATAAPIAATWTFTLATAVGRREWPAVLEYANRHR